MLIPREQEKQAAREIREALHDLERTANAEQLGMLAYHLRLAIVEATEIVDDAETSANIRVADLGKR